MNEERNKSKVPGSSDFLNTTGKDMLIPETNAGNPNFIPSNSQWR